MGTATGVALFGAIAGTPDNAAGFVDAVHVLGILAAVLWLVASGVAVGGVSGRT